MPLISTLLSPLKAKANLVVGVLVLSAILATAAYIVTLRAEVSSQNKKNGELISEIAILKSNISVLKDNNAILDAANSTNRETIDALRNERKRSEDAIASLARKDKANIKKIEELNAYIDLLAKDPANDGALAPVLVEALKAIAERKAAAK